jgi:hypothetical protein
MPTAKVGCLTDCCCRCPQYVSRLRRTLKSYTYGPLYTACRELQGGAAAEAGGLRDIWFPIVTTNLLHVAKQGFPVENLTA